MKINYIVIFILFVSFQAAAQEGPVKTFFGNGSVESEINYKNNIREGEAKFYYENGNLKEERTYLNGKVVGLLRIYYENGNLKVLANLEEGKREGPSSFFDEEGAFTGDVDFAAGRRIIPEPVIPEETLIASETPSVVEEKAEVTPKKKENNLKKSDNLFVPPTLEDTMEDDPAFFSTAEVMPQPVGGMNAVYERLIYPREAKSKNIEGTVKVLLYINEWGDVNQAEVVEGIGYGCDESAKTALYYTKFSPGLIRGKPVKMRIIVSVEFKLNT